ncbi:MAG: hypothetical protein Q9195_002742 [Heterodermia aff. obscurata]
MAASDKKVYRVAVLVFNGTDILDFAGPLEMLTHTMYNTDIDHPEKVFESTVIASTPTVTLNQCVTIQTSLLIPDAIAQIASFDLLVVTGGWPVIIQEMCRTHSPELQLVEAFNNSAPSSPGTEKTIFSICTGALFLAAAGALKGLTAATTHHQALDLLREMDPEVEVVSSVTEGGAPRRYVDGGLNGKGKRVVTAGGVTCGMDGALYIAEMKAGTAAAGFVAGMTEHEWKKA